MEVSAWLGCVGEGDGGGVGIAVGAGVGRGVGRRVGLANPPSARRPWGKVIGSRWAFLVTGEFLEATQERLR